LPEQISIARRSLAHLRKAAQARAHIQPKQRDQPARRRTLVNSFDMKSGSSSPLGSSLGRSMDQITEPP
jgi:hypothetical protein